LKQKPEGLQDVICTDGCAVSVLLAHTTTDYVGLGILSPSEIRLVLSDPNSLVVGVDPGITDVATFATSDGTVGSYSGKRYYEDAKFRRINNWNKETYKVTQLIPTPKTSSFNKLDVFVEAYLPKRLLTETSMPLKSCSTTRMPNFLTEILYFMGIFVSRTTG
jgi:hypothetical protein